jgi:hypothetical protein
MKKRNNPPLIILTLFLVLSATIKTFGQVDSSIAAALAAADTTEFSVNKNDGWQLFNSYVINNGTDSVQFEVILRHNRNIKWYDEQYIGKIKKGSFFPRNPQLIFYNLAECRYQIRIEKNGKCYLKLVAGNPPPGEAEITIPIIVKYKSK